MGLFNFGKKKAITTCANGCLECANDHNSDNASILILGGGCKKCDELETNTKTALKNLGIAEPVGHVRDFNKIAEYGVMSTPALVVDGKVVSFGKVVKPNEIVELIRKEKNI